MVDRVYIFTYSSGKRRLRVNYSSSPSIMHRTHTDI